jgi:peroxiredoxin
LKIHASEKKFPFPYLYDGDDQKAELAYGPVATPHKNYIFNKDDVYELIEAVDHQWQGALPYTIVIEPGGKVIYRKQDTVDPLSMKKLIVGSSYIGRYF